jgi:hypothetical protein
VSAAPWHRWAGTYGDPSLGCAASGAASGPGAEAEAEAEAAAAMKLCSLDMLPAPSSLVVDVCGSVRTRAAVCFGAGEAKELVADQVGCRGQASNDDLELETIDNGYCMLLP